jgi:hypothetical protein
LSCHVPDKGWPRAGPAHSWLLRAALINDLAIGELTHAQLAEKYGRGVDTIHQFAARRADDVRLARQDITVDGNALLYASKDNRLALLDQCLADIEERLQDPDLPDTKRKGYTNTVIALVSKITEIRGEMPARVAVELAAPGKVTYEIPGVDIGALIGSWKQGDGPSKPAGESVEKVERKAPAPGTPTESATRNAASLRSESVPANDQYGEWRDVIVKAFRSDNETLDHESLAVRVERSHPGRSHGVPFDSAAFFTALGQLAADGAVEDVDGRLRLSDGARG